MRKLRRSKFAQAVAFTRKQKTYVKIQNKLGLN